MCVANKGATYPCRGFDNGRQRSDNNFAETRKQPQRLRASTREKGGGTNKKGDHPSDDPDPLQSSEVVRCVGNGTFQGMPESER